MMRGVLHHIELWVPDLTRAVDSLGWLLTALAYTPDHALAYTPDQQRDEGRSWRLGDTYIVVEQSPELTGDVHDRRRPGLNHLAFHVGDATEPDMLVADALGNGWTLLFADRHPHAGGAGHQAGYLANCDGFEVELVANNHDDGGVTGA